MAHVLRIIRLLLAAIRLLLLRELLRLTRDNSARFRHLYGPPLPWPLGFSTRHVSLTGKKDDNYVRNIVFSLRL